MATPSRKPFARELIKICQNKNLSLAFPEGDDPRVWQAASQLLRENCVKKLVLLGPAENIHKVIKQTFPDFPMNDPRLIWASRDLPDIFDISENTFRNYLQKRGKSLPDDSVKEWSQHPANQAAALIHHNIVDAAIGGCIFTTAEIIRASLQGVGLRAGNKTISGSFVMIKETEEDQQRLVFADCGVVIDPTEDQIVDIAIDSCQTFQQLFPDIEPKIAFLSFSTKGSAVHPSAQKMANAQKKFKKLFPLLKSDGELQFDAAFVPSVAQRKCPSSDLEGEANCFIFPNLDAGNLAYKITQRLGGFEAYGPILQGSAKPFSDLSRGSSAHDIFMAALITLLRVNNG